MVMREKIGSLTKITEYYMVKINIIMVDVKTEMVISFLLIILKSGKEIT